ncbi:hypothetical protein CAEBREN_11844 [Caenorhabditis brenneri]|uniref:Uncharacterized protein n=1 Tax=Caenorhabditis brenneri TaxID=135651 RepID=G0N682_CAEBE|nr:hypothetical protein CAEBREN_11844 [Caenorhabditis brenneri]
MGDNNGDPSEIDDAIQELDEARKKYLECEPLLMKVKKFLEKKDGMILDEQEKLVKEDYRLVYQQLQEIREVQKMTKNYSENDSFDAPFTSLIASIQGNQQDSEGYSLMKAELLCLTSEICQLLGGIELRLESVIGVVPRRVILEIFENLLMAFSTLQDILAGILKKFHDVNDGSTLPATIEDWAKITGTIISFLTNVLLKLPGFGIEEDQLSAINKLLDRVISIYCPELFFGFVRALGNLEVMATFKGKIEEHQCQIGLLVEEIEQISEYK